MKKTLLGIALISSFLFITGCNMSSTENKNNESSQQSTVSSGAIKTGDTVKVDYLGKFESGEVFDTSLIDEAKKAGTGVYNPARPYEPIEFTIGSGQMIPGFEKAVIGMKVGESKSVTLKPEDAYGEYSGSMIQEVPADLFSGAGIKPEVGVSYNFGGSQGKILEISGSNVKIDFNNPMAGKTLIFDITVRQINAGTGSSSVGTGN